MLIWLGKQYLGQRDFKYDAIDESEHPLDDLVRVLNSLRRAKANDQQV